MVSATAAVTVPDILSIVAIEMLPEDYIRVSVSVAEAMAKGTG
jgi:hypothetical protein